MNSNNHDRMVIINTIIYAIGAYLL